MDDADLAQPTAAEYHQMHDSALMYAAQVADLKAEVDKRRADEARARALAEQWRQLAINLTRCEHGRVQLDVCNGCPERMSPDQSGRELGYSLDGTFRVVVPRRELMADPAEWYVDAR